MIKYDLTNINKWYNGSRNIVKCYHGSTIAFDLTGGGAPTPTGQTPCYAVTDDISQYQSTDFVDVYDTTADKWYKLNNLNQYEEYGIYGSGRTNTTYYEGKLTIDDGYEYIYSGNSWVNLGEVSGGTATLPNIPFTVNYNAKNYNPSTYTIPMTDGQLNNMDAVITGATNLIVDHHEDGYIELTGTTTDILRANISNTSVNQYFNRDANNPNLTIICKAYTPGTSTEGSVIVNRDSNHNWMYRHKSARVTLHGTSEQGYIAVSNSVPNICSARIDSNRQLTYNNYTQGTTSTHGSSFTYGSNTTSGATLFAGYSSSSGEQWKGVFYWVYMSQNTLTDEQVQQVIDYNEGNGGSPVYPEYYDEIAEPPTSLTFATMADALAYQCPYVGLRAIIAGDKYIFNSNYEWEEIQVFKMVAQYTQGRSYTTACDGDSELTTGVTHGGYEFGEMTSAEIGECIDTVVYGAFSGFTSLTSLTIPNSVTTFGARCISECTSLTSLTLSENTEVIYGYAFYGCSVLQYILINKATPPNLPYNTAFNDTNNCPIYVPSASVNAYKSANNWSTYASRIQAIPT